MKNNHKAYTLLGILIAMFLSSLLIASSVKIYISLSNVFQDIRDQRESFNNFVIFDQKLKKEFLNLDEFYKDPLNSNALILKENKKSNDYEKLIFSMQKNESFEIILVPYKNKKKINNGYVIAKDLYIGDKAITKIFKKGIIINLKDKFNIDYQFFYTNFSSYLKDVKVTRV